MTPRLSLFIYLLFALLCSCRQVVPNAEVCADKGWLGAKCAFTLRGPERQIRKPDWDKERVGYFCMDAKNYGKYQSFIEQACASQQNCVEEVDKFVSNLKGRK